MITVCEGECRCSRCGLPHLAILPIRWLIVMILLFYLFYLHGYIFFTFLCENLHNTYLFILFSPISNFPVSQICHLDLIFFSLEFVAIKNACDEHTLAAVSRQMLRNDVISSSSYLLSSLEGRQRVLHSVDSHR